MIVHRPTGRRPAAQREMPMVRRGAQAAAGRGFTLVELLVVVAVIGVLFAILLPAVQSAREGARRGQCASQLTQLIMAVHHYEQAHGAYPLGTVAAQGPIQNVPSGYHHGWLTQILPYLEHESLYHRIDRSVSVYHRNNLTVRRSDSHLLKCPSCPFVTAGYSSYAGVHHDVEAPIDSTNHGVFVLNRAVRRQDVTDGRAQTLFIGEKFTVRGDLGWMSGTRATLRNTGTRISALLRTVGRNVLPAPEEVPPNAVSFADQAAASDADAGELDAEPPGGAGKGPSPSLETEGSMELLVRAPRKASVSKGKRFGIPSGPLEVGGFGSHHTGGAQFAMGDGSTRFLAQEISMATYQQLGHRADGKLLDDSE